MSPSLFLAVRWRCPVHISSVVLLYDLETILESQLYWEQQPLFDFESVSGNTPSPLPQALCRAEDEEDIVAASQAKAEQVAELAEFNENIPLEDGGEQQEEVEELSKAEQEIAALVEQVSHHVIYCFNVSTFA